MSQQACTCETVELSASDLPVSCPPRDDRVWDAHPRVYLSLNTEGKVVCPYCGTTYVFHHHAK